MSGRQWGYGAAVLLSSAGGLMVEIVAGRLLAPYVGMSLHTWTAVIAVVLAGFSLGHWLGGRLAGAGTDAAKGAARLAAALGVAAVSALAVLVLLRFLAGLLLDSGLGPVAVIVLLALGPFLLPSLAVGVVSPLVATLAVAEAPPGHTGRVLGRLFALGALGSIAGTLLAGYLFISWIGSTGTVLAVAALYALLALGFGWRARMAGTLGGSLLLAAVVVAWAGQGAAAFRSPCWVESDYYCIRIDDFTAEAGRPSALMALDHLAHSINDRDDPGLLYSPYVHLVDELARWRLGAAGGRDAFFVGGGGYSLPRAWAAEHPQARLTVAEIDPAVTAAARDRLWLSASPNLAIVHADARLALQKLRRAPLFDVVFGDAVADISIPPHLVTREFAQEVKARLRPGGFYAVNVVDAGPSPHFLFAFVTTLEAVFPAVEVWVESEQIGSSGRVTFIVVAGDGPSPGGVLRAGRGIERLWRRWPKSDVTARIAEAKVPQLSDDYAPVDRLMGSLLLHETR